MAEVIEVILPMGVGFGDGLSDVAIEYLDVVAGKVAEPIHKRPSTWTHIGISIVAGLASFLVLEGSARVMGGMIAGRHLGKVTGEAAKTIVAPAPAPLGRVRLGREGKIKLEIVGSKEGELRLRTSKKEMVTEAEAI